MQVIRRKSWAIYAKSGGLQLNLAKISDKVEGEDKTIEGWHLFAEAAKSLGDNTKACDWKNKITLKLGLPDIGMILNGIRVKFDPAPDSTGKPKEYKLYHDPSKGGPNEGKVSKSLSIVRGQTYGYMINFGMKNGETKLNFSMPISDEQLILLDILLRESVKLVAGFFDCGEPVFSKD